MQYRVTFPLITTDAERVFATKEEADRFACQRRNIIAASPYMTSLQALRVKVEPIGEEQQQ